MKKLFLSITLLFSVLHLCADEGMWLLKELNRRSAARMQELGFKFPIDSLYNESNPSLKDAVVIFGGGCTGVVVSGQGMVFTNHHCGYDAIQKLSAVEHDYLKDGFASQSYEQELAADGLSVSFLKRTEDLTDFVTSTILPEDSEEVRETKIDSLSKVYLQKYTNDRFHKATIIPFYAGNKYYLVEYEIFRDVRLVFTPPSSVGKFGGDTDNWMWPRHTGDFSVFRVYADKDNNPTEYDPSNKPYTPKYSVPVSLKGYEENDYAMTIGYPGSTERYIPSWGIKQMVESENKPRVEVRTVKQAIWKEAMNASDAIRIKYASKYARSSNYWKNAMGMNEAIAKLNVIGDKEKLEKQFSNWVASSSKNKEKYEKTLSSLEEAYTSSMDKAKHRTYFYESFYSGIEMVIIANTMRDIREKNPEEKADKVRSRLKNAYKDYEPTLDRKVMPALLKLYAESVPADKLPDIYQFINKKFKGNYEKYAEWFYKNTKLTTIDDAAEMIMKDKDFEKDPAIALSMSLELCAKEIFGAMHESMAAMEKGNREYMAGLIEMEPEKAYSPDANFTQRLSYGSIGGYRPADAVIYDYYSTSQGVLEKEKPGDPEFDVQKYILDSIRTADFGEYAAKDGKMYVNFLSDNDITGGNSGSPVFNGNAELLGLAFDGNWESLSGDILFDAKLQRCISVDVRYMLYMMDKVMKCPRLIKELKIKK